MPTASTTLHDNLLPNIVSNPRSYQKDIFEVGVRQNTIAVLDTGSGKTYIAVMLINSIACAINPASEQKRYTIFLAPTVYLVNQQYIYIKAHTSLRVGQYYGAMNVDFWSSVRWHEEISKCDVMVMTPQVLLDALRTAVLSLELVHLLILDECHRATGNHPYAKIMKEYYHKSRKRPKVFGMTASPVIRKGISSNLQCEDKISELESILDSQIYTVKDRAEVEMLVPSAKQLCKFYDQASFDYSKLKAKLGSSFSKFDSELIKLNEFVQNHCKDVDDRIKMFRKRLSNVHSKILHCLDDGGLLCAYEAVIHCIENSPTIWNVSELYGKCSLQYKCFLEKALFFCEEFFPQGKDDLLIVSDNSNAVCTGCISPKLYELIRFFLSFGKDVQVSCLVFVERIITAIAVMRTIKKISCLSHLSVSFLSGSCSSVDALTRKLQKETLQSFHGGKINLLITTDVLEEGIDVSDCSYVIRFDLPKTVRSYVQSRGRARQKNSGFIMMIERGNRTDIEQLFDIFRSVRSVDDTTRKRDPDVYSIKPCSFKDVDAYFVDATGANVTADSSVQIIHQYCAKLPGDKYFFPKPKFQFSFSEGSYTCELTLPVNAAFSTLVGPLSRNSNVSKQLVCLEACKKLHHLGALDDRLLPSIEDPDEIDLSVMNNDVASGAGTTKRKELHGTACIHTLSGTWADKDICVEFQAYDMRFDCNVVDNVYSGFILLLESKLDDDVGNIQVELFLGTQKVVKSSVSFYGKILLDPEEVKKAKIFQELFFNGLFGKLFLGTKSKRSFLLSAENNLIWSPSNMYLLLPNEPISSGCLKIDWRVINSSFSAVEFLKKNCWFGHQRYTTNGEKALSNICIADDKDKNIDVLHLANNSFNIRDLKEKVVIAIHTGKIYSVVSVLHKSSAESPFDTDDYKTFGEYFNKKYGIILMYPGQPLLMLKQSHNPHNLLVNFSYKAASSSGKTLVAEKPRFYAHMPPELLVVVDVSHNILKSLYLLPSLMHRLESLMLASQLRRDIACHFCNVPSSLILEALTTLGCCEVFSMERLEFLGDSVLKYAVCCYLFLKYPNKHEGQLSAHCQGIVSNSNLYKVGTTRNLQVYIRDSAFEPIRWTAPGQCSAHAVPCMCGVGTMEVPLGIFNTEEKVLVHKVCDMGHRWMGSKTISDCVEALIGAYFTCGGLDAAVFLLNWFGIFVEFDPSSVADVVKTASLHCYTPKERSLEILEDKLGYKFSIKGLLLEAVTHASVGKELEVSYCYQRLEFLGDSVLGLLITRYLYQNHAHINPGLLTDLRSASVNNENFAQVAVRHNLHPYLQHCSELLSSQIQEYAQSLSVDVNSKLTQTLKGPKALGDMIESIAGAILIDKYLNIDEVWSVFKPLLSPIVTPDTLELHPWKRLTDLCSSLGYFTYQTCIKIEKEIVVDVTVQCRDEMLTGQGCGKRKKDARDQAALNLIKDLEERGISQSSVFKRKHDEVASIKDEDSAVSKKQKTTMDHVSAELVGVPSSTNESPPPPVIECAVKLQKGGPRQALFNVCKKQSWVMPKLTTVEHKPRSEIKSGEGPEKRAGLIHFVSNALVCIPNYGTVECSGDPKSDKKASRDSAALNLLYEFQRLGKLILLCQIIEIYGFEEDSYWCCCGFDCIIHWYCIYSKKIFESA